MRVRIPAAVLITALQQNLAHAAPVPEESHRLAGESFRQAQAAFARREFAAAAAAFEQAARLEPHPSPLLDAEEAWELAGEPVHAAEDCDLVLAMPGLADRFRLEAARRLRALEPRVSTVEITGPPATLVRLDGAPEVVVPLHRRVAPGRHELVLIATASAPRSLTMELTPGETRTLDAGGLAPDVAVTPTHDQAEPVSSPIPSAPPSNPALRDSARGGPSSSAASRHVPTGSWVALGVSVASAAVGVGFGVSALNANSDYASTGAESDADAFRRDRVITNVAWGAAIASAVTGVVFWLAAPNGPKGASASVAPESHGMSVVAVTRF
jgi:hypothetical protein